MILKTVTHQEKNVANDEKYFSKSPITHFHLSVMKSR